LKQNLNILICPLEWGLGHSGRSIVLAKKLRASGNNILIGAGKEHLAFFKKELPGLTYIDFPGYKPGYSRYLPQYLKLLLDVPILIFHSAREHKNLKRIIREHSIDMVISDNRFGLWNNEIRSVYITHMPRIPFPAFFRFLEFTGILLHRMIIKRYSLCFIPDLPGELNVSGRLSHGLRLPSNVRYIGLLSRFSEVETGSKMNPVNVVHNTVILSGPEPQREMLKNRLFNIFRDKEPVTVFFGGKPDDAGEILREGNIIWYDHPDAVQMKELILTSKSIIARAGYTSIMELISLGRSALLIPTPGQTEQEYLARSLTEKGWFTFIHQKQTDKGVTPPSVEPAWPDQLIAQSKIYLEKAIEELLKEQQQHS